MEQTCQEILTFPSARDRHQDASALIIDVCSA